MKQIAPQQGELLLFPRYLWHRTTPFTGEGERLVAFDYVVALTLRGFADRRNDKAGRCVYRAALISTGWPKVVEWPDHQHPELSNADHLRLTSRLRQIWMDTELVDLPFASKARGVYQDREVGVMHACGHDNHVAILMGVAEVLAGMGDDLPGTVKFIFQPAEEGTPDGSVGGAELMLMEGAFENPRPDVVFGLHVFPFPAGTIATRPGGLMASSDRHQITIKGKQTHGAVPWAGVDPIVTASQVVLGLQTIVSRQLDATLTPSIVTIGRVEGGVRNNIIPESVELEGTIRTFDAETRIDIHKRIRRTATNIAEAAGATADVVIDQGYGVTRNDPNLFRQMSPTLERVAGDRFIEASQTTTAEDFSYFANEVPGLFLFLGVAPDDPTLIYPNHSPRFYADERALPVGVEALTSMTLDYMMSEQ